MGMYTQLHFGASLREDTPESVLDIIRYMSSVNDKTPQPKLPEHKFFRCSRWHVLFCMDSAYFDYKTQPPLDDALNSYMHLSFTSNLKNYDHEIEHFLDWIYQYLDNPVGEFLGYYRYEETTIPTLLFMGSNKINLLYPSELEFKVEGFH